MSPVAVPCTISEEKLSAVEFKVTVPLLLVKFPETVKEDVSSTHKLAPDDKVIDVIETSVLITG
jgi:hypothetical protein